MSLLYDASLIVTPNAYKEGKLYALKPSNGDGDFTFTRATTATRVNSAGLVELVPYNLLQYSEQFDNAAWTKTAVTVGNNTTVAPNGTLTAYTLSIGVDATNARHRLHSATFTSQIIGTTYTATYYLKANQHQWIQILGNIGYSNGVWANFDLINGTIGNTGGVDTTASIESVGDGWYKCVVSGVATGTFTTGFEVIVINNTNGGRYPLYQSTQSADVCYIWGAQLVEGTSARDYLRTETRLNIPRIDYSLGGCPNILLEPQRTNLALYSENFADVTWAKLRTTVTQNTTNSPDNTLNADTIEVSSSGQAYFSQGVTTTVGTVNVSIYCKYINQQFLQIYSSSSGQAYANFDILNGLAGSNGTSASNVVITPAANGFYRISVALVVPAAAINIRFAFVASSTSVYNPPDGVAGKQFYAWGAAIETGTTGTAAYATSYIPTTTASVTRNTDIINRSNIFTNGLITAAGGTWFVELRNNIALTRDSVGGIWVGDNATAGTLGNAFVIRHGGGSQRLSIGKTISGSFTNLFTTTSDTCKIAIKWNGSTADVFVNGVKQVSATAFTITNMDFLVGNGNDVPKYINQMSLYPTPLSDSELISMTTL